MKKSSFKFISVLLSLILILVTFSPGIVMGESSEGEIKMIVEKITVDNEVNPLGIDNETPSFAWVLSSDSRSAYQAAYRIVVSSSEDKLNSGDYIWDTGKVTSDTSTGVTYSGPALQSQQRYFWKVCVWNQHDNVSEWSENGWFETAFLNASDWGAAQWIGGNSTVKTPVELSMNGAYWIWHEADGAYWSSMDACTRYFRRTFTIDSISDVTAACIAMTADDEYDLYVNGILAAQSERVANSWKKAQYVDITSLLKTGENVFAVVASNKLGSGGAKTGGGLLSSAKIVTKSGETNILTNSDWVTSDTLIDGWTATDFDDSNWTPAKAQQVYGSSPWGGAVSIFSENSNTNPAPILRKSIWFPSDVAEARAYVCGLGYFVMYIDGERVGTNVLDPGVTVYNKTALYVVHDVTEILSNKGSHSIGVELGRGFYGLPAEDTSYWNTAKWLGEPRLKFKLSVTFTDGTTTEIISDSSWRTADSPTLRDSVYMGETYDATKEIEGWKNLGFDDSGWRNAVVMDAPTNNLISQRVAPIRVVDSMSAESVTDLGNGKYVLKFPVVTAGWAKLKVTGTAGTKVTLTYGETLNSDGTVNNAGSSGLTNGPIQVDNYILKGGKSEIWEPSFSYKGFQYIEVEGYPGTAEEAKENITAQIVHSDIKESGVFESSNELLNQIHDITLRTMVNNSHSFISDTPMFEKRGWLGDANVMIKSTINNFGMRAFYKNWLYSIRDNQSSSGGGTVLSPNKSDGWCRDSIWGGAIISMPYTLYKEYGDVSFLSDNYTYMQYEMNYLRKYRTDADGLIDYADYGDWLSPTYHKPPEDTSLINTAYAYQYALMMEEAATVLNKPTDAADMREYAQNLKTAFNNKWLDTEKGIYDTGNGEEYRQTSNAVPLMFGLVPEEYVDVVAENLASDVKSRGNKLNAGFAGIKELFPALSIYGYNDTAFAVATGKEYPSYGYWIENGATTLWEFWELTSRSRDHCLHGSIDDWFYSYLGGIKNKTVGYKEFNIKPYMPEKLNEVKASLETSYGTVSSAWVKNAVADTCTYDVSVPVNTTAYLTVLTSSADLITENGVAISDVDGVKAVDTNGAEVTITLGSGDYSFKVEAEPGNVTFSDTTSNTALSFAEKVQLLTVKSQYKGTELKLNGLTMEYMQNNYNTTDNAITDWKIVGYTGAENTTFVDAADLANLKDLDFVCSGSASGSIRSAGTFATKSHNHSIYTLNSGGVNIGYENTTTSNVLHGADRISENYYDALVTLTLDEVREIEDIYLFGQWTTDLAIPTYAIYVSENEEDLYESKNQVCLFDYYEGYKLDLGVTSEDKPHKLTCKGRNSEGQLWKFTEEKPIGKYVGFKIYDAAAHTTEKSFLAILDMGVFGNKLRYNTASFLDNKGNEIGTIKVREGYLVADYLDELNAISEKLPEVYGYKKFVVDGIQQWNINIYEPFVADATFAPIYNIDESLICNVSATDTKGKKFIAESMRFDTRINLADSDATGWKIGEKVITTGSSAVLYACGTSLDIVAVAEEVTAEKVSIVGHDMRNNSLAVFAHTEMPQNAVAYGFIFGSVTYYNDSNYTFTLADTEAFTQKLATYKEIEISANSGKDFMGLLTNIAANKTRYARAYVRYRDGSVVYSEDIISATNEEAE